MGVKFYIPLEPEQYLIASITDLVHVNAGYQYRWSDRHKNTVNYILCESLQKHLSEQELAELVIEYNNGTGVCIITDNHRLVRYFTNIILGWDILVTVPDRLAKEVEQWLKENGHGRYYRTVFHDIARTPFNLEDFDDATMIKMKFEDVQIHKSKVDTEKTDD